MLISLRTFCAKLIANSLTNVQSKCLRPIGQMTFELAKLKLFLHVTHCLIMLNIFARLYETPQAIMVQTNWLRPYFCVWPERITLTLDLVTRFLQATHYLIIAKIYIKPPLWQLFWAPHKWAQQKIVRWLSNFYYIKKLITCLLSTRCLPFQYFSIPSACNVLTMSLALIAVSWLTSEIIIFSHKLSIHITLFLNSTVIDCISE